MSFENLECVQIGPAHEDLTLRTEAYLRAKGWEYKCQTIDCCWRWYKTINGRRYGCGTSDAFKIQDHLDREEYANAHPDEFNA